MARGQTTQPSDGVVALIDGFIGRAVETGASDVHFEPTDEAVLVRFRVDGRLHDVERLPVALLPNVVTRLKVMAGLLTYRVDIPQEGGLALGNGHALDVRISTFPTIRGERAAVRLLPRTGSVRTLDELGLSDRAVGQLLAATADRQGLLLATGPAGSGKTTTLYAILRHLLATLPGTSIMTVEDPVECRLDGVAQIQVTPQGELTYARALRSLLRQDPQIILIGEIRDAETAHIAIEASLTGHLLLSTMHSGSPAEAIVRLREMGIAGYQLTSAVRLVLSQRLLRAVCGRCQGRARADDDGQDRGCTACLGSGFRGRTACAEVADMSSALRAAILDSADAERLASVIGAAPGHADLAADARRHVTAGRTTATEAESVVGRPIPSDDA